MTGEPNQIRRRGRLLLTAGLLALAASGCTAVPGSHISRPDSNPWFGGGGKEESDTRLPDIVRVHQILPGSDEQAQPAPEPVLPPELDITQASYDYVAT